MPSEPVKMKQKEPIACMRCDVEMALKPAMPTVVLVPSWTTVLNKTMATASFRTDSPNMMELRFGSAPIELNEARGVV